MYYLDDSTTFSLTETGTWVGPGDIKEYVDFTTSHLFNMYDTTNDVEMEMILATHDSCSAIFTGTNRYQVDSKFHPPGGKCLETLLAYTLHWEVEPFKVKKINLFSPKQRMETLFNVDLSKFYIYLILFPCFIYMPYDLNVSLLSLHIIT